MRGLVGLVPACNSDEFTRRNWLQGLVPRTVHMKPFEEQVTETCPKNSNWFELVEIVAETKAGPCDKNLKQKWPAHTMRPVAGTNPIVCADLYMRIFCIYV